MYRETDSSRVQVEPSLPVNSTAYPPPIGSNVTFPSLPILAVLIFGALMVTGMVAFP